MKSKISVVALIGVIVSTFWPNITSAQTSASLILTGIERITDTGVDSSAISGLSISGRFRKYRREINLVGSINGIASIPAATSGSTNYNTGLVDQSDATLGSTYRQIGGDRNNGSYIDMLGFTSRTTLNDVSGKLIVKEATYETQRLANRSVILVFPRSVQTYPRRAQG